VTGYGAAIRTATTKSSRDAAIRTAMLDGGFSVRDVARVLGIVPGSAQSRARKMGLVYDKTEGKWVG
jgi:hypothetical protein